MHVNECGGGGGGKHLPQPLNLTSNLCQLDKEGTTARKKVVLVPTRGRCLVCSVPFPGRRTHIFQELPRIGQTSRFYSRELV